MDDTDTGTAHRELFEAYAADEHPFPTETPMELALKKDVEAAYKGDPAAKTYLEIIRSYPGFLAMMVQRVAHTLYQDGASEDARELTDPGVKKH